MYNKCDDCFYKYPSIQCVNCGIKFKNFTDKNVINKITLNDVSYLMQEVAKKKYTFSITACVVPNCYNLYVSYITKESTIKSLGLTFNENDGMIYGKENSLNEKFDDIDKVFDFICEEIGD